MIDDADFIELKTRLDAAVSVDNAGDSGIGGAHHRHTFFHCAETGAGKVLIWAGTASEPSVICQAQQPLRMIGSIGDFAGKDQLVADQRPDRRQARQMQRAGPGPAVKSIEPGVILATKGKRSRRGTYSP